MSTISDEQLRQWSEGFRLLEHETLAGVLAEYEQVAARAQHAGHADILREALDGQKSMG